MFPTCLPDFSKTSRTSKALRKANNLETQKDLWPPFCCLFLFICLLVVLFFFVCFLFCCFLCVCFFVFVVFLFVVFFCVFVLLFLVCLFFLCFSFFLLDRKHRNDSHYFSLKALWPPFFLFKLLQNANNRGIVNLGWKQWGETRGEKRGG